MKKQISVGTVLDPEFDDIVPLDENVEVMRGQTLSEDGQTTSFESRRRKPTQKVDEARLGEVDLSGWVMPDWNDA
jgi:hypothetical protein